jgi:hypothetical protein
LKISNKGLIDDDDDDDASPVVVAGPGRTQAFAVYIYIIFLFFIIGPRIIWDVINRHPHMIRVAWSTLLAFQLLRIKITAEKEIQDFQLLD